MVQYGKISFVLLFISVSFYAGAQDTIARPTLPGYKKWTEFRAVPRLGLGAQGPLFLELGMAGHRFLVNDLGYASAAFYNSIEWSPTRKLYGLKLGYEVNARILAAGLELKYQANLYRYDLVITPRLGLGAMGVVNIFYGYNFSIFRFPFTYLSPHQLSVVFNYNRLVFNRKKN